MRHEKLFTSLHAAVIAFLLGFGSVGCMVTGLNLPVSGMGIFALACGLTAAIGSLCLRWKGSWILLLGALLAYIPCMIWGDSTVPQVESMLRHISTLYDNAYGTGILFAGTVTKVVDIPLLFIGIWATILACWDVVRSSNWIDGKVLPLLAAASCIVVTDTVPDSFYLYLWMLGMLLLILTGATRRRSKVQGAYLTHIAAVPAALALAILFLAVPREGYDNQPYELQTRIANWIAELPDLWESVSDDTAAKLDGTVQTTRVDLKKLGPRLKRVYPVMEVESPVDGTIYLRGQDFDTYTGFGWTADSSREEGFSYLRSPDLLQVTFPKGAGIIQIRTKRKLDVLYIPYYPAINITLSGGRTENRTGLTEYSYSLVLPGANWQAVINSDTNSVAYILVIPDEQEENPGMYRALPEETYAGAVEILRQILTTENTATEVADAVARYVKGSALYDLNTQSMPAGETDFALWFLRDSETGYCVHFATAATVLLRAAGVEARYVEGYMTTAAAGETVTVTADQAHAWVEYYEPLVGAWVVLEATPPDLTEPETVAGTRPQEETVPQTTAGEDFPGEIPDVTQAPDGETAPGREEPSGQDQEERGSQWWLWLLLPLLIWAALEGQRKVRLRRRYLGCRRGKANRRALALWGEIALLSGRLGEDPPEEAREIAEKAKYSPHRVSAEELTLLEGCFRQALERIKGRPWYEKIVDSYIFAVC